MLGRVGRRIVAAAATVAVIGGCGDGHAENDGSKKGTTGSPSSVTATATATATATVDTSRDRRIAERSVVTLDDFPSGWTAADQTEKSRVHCPQITTARNQASGVALSPRFNEGEATQVESAVYVFPDEASAARHFAAMSSRATRLCYASQITKALGGRSDLKLGDIRTAQLALGPLGEESSGARLTIPVASQGVNVDLYADLVFARAGRGLSLGLFLDAYGPFDEDLRADLTAKQIRRLSHAVTKGRAG